MEEMIPKILASPKPSTFQHYLVQDKDEGHDPDRNEQLAHYGSSRSTTQIRGVKHYWHRGKNPDFKARDLEKDKDGKIKNESQLTRMVPLKPDVTFSSRIHFENLKPEELGLLWWALALPADDNKTYCHKIGMGKPLGMGGVHIKPTLTLTKRPKRYQTLFTGEQWQAAEEMANPQTYIADFEQYILAKVSSDERPPRFTQMERIRMLLAMLTWHEDDPAWTEATRYMEIEYGPRRLNEYKERPVLPDPLEIGK